MPAKAPARDILAVHCVCVRAAFERKVCVCMPLTCKRECVRVMRQLLSRLLNANNFASHGFAAAAAAAAAMAHFQCRADYLGWPAQSRSMRRITFMVARKWPTVLRKSALLTSARAHGEHKNVSRDILRTNARRPFCMHIGGNYCGCCWKLRLRLCRASDLRVCACAHTHMRILQRNR